jgi:hypothetical protein
MALLLQVMAYPQKYQKYRCAIIFDHRIYMTNLCDIRLEIMFRGK